MFYKALGFAVWKLGVAYMRRRYARQAKVGAMLMLVSLVAVGYMAKRSSE
jgi:asparagine N-glycosylation enzyme membrane subunit Stt3